MVFLLRPSINAIMVRTVTCVVNDFVEATPISGPACVYTPASVSRGMLEPTTLQMPTTTAFAALANRIAANVSAVSPLWLMAITKSFSLMIGLRYLNSEAYSTSTGMRAYSSIKYSPTKPACHDVPHATMIILSALSNLSKTL